MSVSDSDTTYRPGLHLKLGAAVAFLGLLILCGLAVFGAWFMTIQAAHHGRIQWTYPYSAYLVDYSAGFIRRGAIGAIVGHLTHGQPRLLLISQLVFANYAILIICVCALILLNARRKLETALLVLLLPSGIVMAGLMGGFFMWKEALFLTALAALGCGYNIIVRLPPGAAQRILGRFLIAGLLAFSVFASFAQESFVFLAAPAFAYLLIALTRISFAPTRRETRFSTWYVAAMLALFLIIGLVFHGTAAQVSSIWQHLNPVDRQLYAPGDYGDLGFLSYSARDQLNSMTHVATSGFTWWYLSPLALYFLYCAAIASLVGGKARGWSLCYLSIAICAAPMFILGLDYGRWVIMIQMTFLITLLSLGRERLATIHILPWRMTSVERKLDRFEAFSDTVVQRHVPVVTAALLLFTLTFRMPLIFVTDPFAANTEGAFPAAVVYTMRCIKHLH